jgi:hypothetical protein
MRTEATSADPLEAHDATERETKKPKLQDAHGEHALTHNTLASQGHLARPASQPHQNAMQADGASAQLLKTDEATQRKTKKPRLRNAEARLRQQANQAARRVTKATEE